MKKYDVIIIGAGPAGLTAAIYALRAGKKVVVCEKELVGGVMNTADKIDNYPGFSSISGYELSQNMYNHAKGLGAEFVYSNAVKADLKGEEKNVSLQNGEQIAGNAVILAMGIWYKQLGLDNEVDLIGQGISYCATCDGPFFKNKTVMVAGNASAKKDIEYLLSLVQKLYIVDLSKNEFLKIIKDEKIEYFSNCNITALNGKPLKSVNIDKKEIAVSGLFVAIGKSPNTNLVKGQVDLDDKGFIKVDNKFKTNLDNVFAVGDIASGTLKQVVSACASGAVASLNLK